MCVCVCVCVCLKFQGAKVSRRLDFSGSNPGAI